jgi:hypothetical protein
MKKLTFVLLFAISGSACSGEERGGYGTLLEQINIDASYSATKQNAIKSLGNIPSGYVEKFSRHAYERFLRSQSQADYTGILEIIPSSMLSDVVEAVMLAGPYGYDYLDHEFYFAKTPGIAFNNESSVFWKVAKDVEDECEREVWNALFIAKGAGGKYRFNTSCKLISELISGRTKFTKEELLEVYYQFRDIDGY